MTAHILDCTVTPFSEHYFDAYLEIVEDNMEEEGDYTHTRLAGTHPEIFQVIQRVGKDAIASNSYYYRRYNDAAYELARLTIKYTDVLFDEVSPEFLFAYTTSLWQMDWNRKLTQISFLIFGIEPGSDEERWV